MIHLIYQSELNTQHQSLLAISSQQPILTF